MEHRVFDESLRMLTIMKVSGFTRIYSFTNNVDEHG